MVQEVDFNDVYHHTKFEPNLFTNVQKQANICGYDAFGTTAVIFLDLMILFKSRIRVFNLNCFNTA